jgi:N-acetylneuraminate synthase
VTSVINIDKKTIGENSPTYLIAEIGINHNGSLENALKLIENAKFAGFDAVKFQKRTIEVVYSPQELQQERPNFFGSTNGDLKRGLEFGLNEYSAIDAYCKKLEITWFASPWDEKSVDFLESFDIPVYKIASASLTDFGLLNRVKKVGRPVILSTGMSTMNQIEQAVAILDSSNLILMHTVSTYPAKDEQLNLSAIQTLKNRFPEIPIGYSGHEVGLLPSVIAVAKFGAVCVERHITLDRSMWGSDQAASIELEGMLRLARDIRQIPKLNGSGEKKILDEELPIQKKLRRVDNLPLI